jgi:hypothetical protein
MKIAVGIRENSTGREWIENHDLPNVSGQANAEAWAQATLDTFNKTLRPYESPRTLTSVTIEGVSAEHRWQKISPVTQISPRGRIYDVYKCADCEVTGKRIGLSSVVKRDSKYRAKKWATCQHTVVR